MKVKRVWSVGLCMVLLLALLAGCGGGSQSEAPAGNGGPESGGGADGGAADGEALTIGFSVITQTFPYYVSMTQGFVDACEAMGWNYILTEAGMDVEKTINDCSDLIQKEVDVLVIASWYGDSLLEVFQQCRAADIPVFLIDTGSLPEDGDYVTNIGTVDYDAGLTGGLWTAQYFLARGKQEIDYIAFATATTVGRNRADGFLAGLQQGGLRVNPRNEYLGESRESYMASCEDALVTYAQLDLIFATNAQGGLGAYDACVGAGRTEVNIVGFDAEDDEVKLIDQDTQYIASIQQMPYEMAGQTVQNIYDYLYNGAAFEKATPFESGIYTVDGSLTTQQIAQLG